MSLKIKLNGNIKAYALISQEDYKIVSKYNWRLNGAGYAESDIDDIIISMHKFIMKKYQNIPKGMKVDHINRKKLDNRRGNLRLVTLQLNNQNKSISKSKKSSNYRGIFYNKRRKKYFTNTRIGSSNGKAVYLGAYDNEIDAAEAFDMYIIHNNYSHIELNFPEKRDDYLKRKYIPYKNNMKKLCEYIGVHKDKNKFVARITFNKKRITILINTSQIACAKAYDKFIVDNNIPGKKLNFPEDYPKYNYHCVAKMKCKETKDKNIVRLLMKNKSNKIVLIDKEDFDKIKYYAWYIAINTYTKKNYVRSTSTGKYMSLHHFIMGVDSNIIIDHIDGNGLNNCKSNLRISDEEKNAHNFIKNKNTSSKYMNVHIDKGSNKWRAAFIFHYKTINIGSYNSEEYAARARDLYILIHHKDDHYKLNFNDWSDKIISYWKKKIIPMSKKNPDKWIPKTYNEQIGTNISEIIEAFDKNKFLLVEKLNEFLTKKIKNKTNEYMKILKI